MAATLMTTAIVTAALEATASKVKPKDRDPFRKGDAVVYPTHGVGTVDSIGFEEIAGHQLNLILISFGENQMTLRVPVAQARAAGLRKLVSRTEFGRALVKLKRSPKTSRLIWARRAQDCLAKINSGDVEILAEVVRDLQTSGDHSTGSFTQRNLYELALDRLAGEFAAINGMTKSEAISQLTLMLLEARTARIEQLDRQVARV